MNEPTVDPGMTLDAITNRYPETIEVFNQLGVDICCGGDATLAQAVERDGLKLAVVQSALADALRDRPREGRR